MGYLASFIMFVFFGLLLVEFFLFKRSPAQQYKPETSTPITPEAITKMTGLYWKRRWEEEPDETRDDLFLYCVDAQAQSRALLVYPKEIVHKEQPPEVVADVLPENVIPWPPKTPD